MIPFRTLFRIFAGTFLVLAPPTARADEPAQLKFGFPAPPTSYILTEVVTPWVKEVEADAGDALKIVVYPGGNIATFRNAYDRTLNGVSDITFGLFGELSGQFPKSDVATLPFETENCTEAAVVLWRLYEKGITADEFDKVRVLALFQFPATSIHTPKQIKTLADMKGMKLSVTTRMIGQNIEKLGATPINMPPTEIYQSINRGTIEGVATSWPAVGTFKIEEVTKYHIEAPLATSPAFFFMNKDSYAKLPAAARQALDRKSGEPLSRRLGKASDNATDAGREKVKALGQIVTGIPGGEEPLWRERIQVITDDWLKQTPDGARVLTAFRDEIKRIRAGM